MQNKLLSIQHFAGQSTSTLVHTIRAANMALSKCFFIVLLLTVGALTNRAHSANILCLLGTPSTGHHVWHKSLLQALVGRGHNLTVLTAEPAEMSIPPRLHFIRMSGVYDAIYERRLTSPKESSIAAYLSRTVFGRIVARYSEQSQVDGLLVDSDGAKQLLNYPDGYRFDVVLHDSSQAQALLGFVDHFGTPPLVSLYPAGLASVSTSTVNYPSYQPHPDGPYLSHEMTFIERTRNLSYFLFDWFYRSYVYMVNENRKARRLFGPTMRSLESIEANTELVLANVDFALDSAKMLLSNVVPVGALQALRKESVDKVNGNFL